MNEQGGGGGRAADRSPNGINANRNNVLMFLAERPGCCVQKSQSLATMYVSARWQRRLDLYSAAPRLCELHCSKALQSMLMRAPTATNVFCTTVFTNWLNNVCPC